MRFLNFLPFLLLLASLPAMAQFGVYGEFSTTNLHTANEPQLYGPTLGGYYHKTFGHHLSLLSAGPDVRVSFLSGPGSGANAPMQSLTSILAGPRLTFKLPVTLLHLYAEGLIGDGDPQLGEGASRNSGNRFESQFLGGVDLTILPHVDWRIIELGDGELPASGGSASLDTTTFSTGIVVRMP